MLEKLGQVQAIVSVAVFLFANTVVQLQLGAWPTVEHWGSSGMFKALVGSARTLKEWEPVPFGAIAIGARLKVL